MNLLDEILGGDAFIGFCDECRWSKTFRTQRERDLWERNHCHNPEVTE